MASDLDFIVVDSLPADHSNYGQEQRCQKVPRGTCQLVNGKLYWDAVRRVGMGVRMATLRRRCAEGVVG